jgi:hypothetical protein|nr:MAG TPA: hypothetical protein [Caudoviricetes sp.]
MVPWSVVGEQPFYHGRQSGQTLGSPDRRAKESPPKLAGKGTLTEYKEA